MRSFLVLFYLASGVPLLAQHGQLPALNWRLRSSLVAEKFTTFQNVAETAPSYLMNHSLDRPGPWDQGFEGLGRRIGSTYAEYGIREGIELAMFAVHKEDPRYVRMGGRAIGRRMGHVLKSILFSHDAQGREVVALNNFTGMLGTRVMANTWLPATEHTTQRVVFSVGVNLLGKGGGNALREFWPDIRARFRR